MRFVRQRRRDAGELLPRRHTSVVNRLDVVITQCRGRGSRVSKMERDESDFMRAPRVHEPPQLDYVAVIYLYRRFLMVH